MRLAFAAATDVGLVRKNNEDCYVADGDLSLFAVVDGIGGHAFGEVAASAVAGDLTAFIRETAESSDHTWPYGLDPSLSGLANRLQVAIRTANRRLAARVRDDASLDGIGATLVAALVHEGQVAISNVGDCVAYLLRGGQLAQLTRDHSLVAEQIALGLIDSAQARKHPLRHVLTRAVSGDATMPVDILELEAQPGDRLLLCSDGVHGVMTDAELATACGAREASPEAICSTIIAAVKERGAPDNATVIVVAAV